jgi:excisionase family DNA binding protein
MEQVAEHLHLHVRTVRNYVRAGRLKAVRIGKQYRVAREDVEAMTGRPLAPTARDAAKRRRQIEVSAIVQIDAIGPEQAIRMTNAFIGAAKGRTDREEPLSVQTVYDEERGSLKVIVIGGAGATARLLDLVSLQTRET